MPATEPKNLIDVLHRLDQWRQATEFECKRRFTRYDVRGEARLESLDDYDVTPPQRVKLRDIGRGGVGFLTDQDLEPFSTWRLRFEANGHPFASQPISVCFCRVVQDDLYLVGAQFIVEPYIMTLLGVPPAKLLEDEQPDRCGDLTRDFVSPEAALG